mmetsp:Transcript_19104/g.53209  ORF Transcript_19104/g.53209 Transcript_19104/m.53209 type:complete len:92 (-) Transcript_19104:1755-2030(-)
MYHPEDFKLINLDVLKDCPDEATRCRMPQSTAQQSQVDRNQGHISKIEAELQHTVHLSLENEVVDAVQEYVDRSGCTRSESSPLPQIVLSI